MLCILLSIIFILNSQYDNEVVQIALFFSQRNSHGGTMVNVIQLPIQIEWMVFYKSLHISLIDYMATGWTENAPHNRIRRFQMRFRDKVCQLRIKS